MWIAIGIVAGIIGLVTFLLLLPLKITIKTDQNGEFSFDAKLLFLKFKPKEKSDSSLGDTLKELLGANKLNKKSLKENTQKQGFSDTLKETLSTLADFIKELVGLLKHCTATNFKIKVICRGQDAADTAVKYGRYCSVIYPAVGLIASLIKIKKRNMRLNVFCDYDTTKKDEFACNVTISVRIFRLLGALFRLAVKQNTKNEKQQKLKSKKPKA